MSIDPPVAGPADLGPPPLRPAERHATNKAGLLYGAVVAAATLAVADDEADHAVGVDIPLSAVLENVLAVVLTLAIYYTVHVYTQVLGTRSAVEPLGRQVWRAMGHEITVLLGGIPATVVYLAFAFHDPTRAGAWALQATTVLLGVFTWVLARRAGVRGPMLALEVVAVALLGVLMIVLKAALH